MKEAEGISEDTASPVTYRVLTKSHGQFRKGKREAVARAWGRAAGDEQGDGD